MSARKLVGEHYVYLLCDPRDPDPLKSVFYVGKGKGARAMAHRDMARAEMASLKHNAEIGGEQTVSEVLGRKLAILAELDSLGLEPRVEVLASVGGKGISEDAAFDVEAAIIATLGLEGLSNVVRGHGVRMMPESVFDRAATARVQNLPPGRIVVAVPVEGLWGGKDYAGTLLSASDEDRWNNARWLWSPFSASVVARLRDAADTDEPAILIALAKHPDSRRRNIVVGVYEIMDVFESDEVKGTRARGGVRKEYNGWVFLRRELQDEHAATRSARELLEWQTAAKDGEPLKRPEDRAYPQGL